MEVGSGHKISTREKIVFSKKLLLFFTLSLTGQKVGKTSPLFPTHCSVLQTFSCLPRPSGSSYNFPQMKSSGDQAQASAQQHSSTPCRLQPSPVLLSCFPICLSPFHTSPPWPSSSSSLLLLPPPVPCFSAFLATHTASLDGWLAPKTQPHTGPQ